MDKKQNNPDYLKPLESICSVDPRSDNQAVLDILRPGAIGIDDHHANVAKIRLNAAVPESVFVQFETAKNLYLYAWFVYRFYPVAQHHALTCLELGLKLRFPGPLPKMYWSYPNGRKPTLRPLLRYAVDTGAIKNEDFRQWREQVVFRAKQRYLHELTKMVDENLDGMELDYSQAVPNDQDRDWDYLSVLLEVLPGLRNSYAHGSIALHNQALGTLELVAEIFNQLFKANE